MSEKMRFGMHYESPIIFDLEISGLDPKEHEIIQIAAIHPVSHDCFELKVKFNLSKASDEALEINHYSKERWQHAVSQEEAAIMFNKFCRDHVSISKKSKKSGKPYRTAVLMGYNNSYFDKPFIDRLMEKWVDFSAYDYRMYDVYELAKWLLPWENEYNLVAMMEYFKLPPREAHDALQDVYMTRDVAACLIEILAESKTYDMPEWVRNLLEDFDANDDIPF